MATPRKYASSAERQAAYRARRSASASGGPGVGAEPQWPRIPSSPGYHRWNAMVRLAQSLTQSVVSEMTSYYETRSEGWQSSERGESFVERLESIEEVVGLMQELA